MTHEEKLIEALQKLARIASRLLAQAYLLQEQFNLETYEISSRTVAELEIALAELEAIEAESPYADWPQIDQLITQQRATPALPSAEQVVSREAK